MTRIQPPELLLQGTWFLVFIFSFADSLEVHDNPSIPYTYSRFSDIKDQCGSILSSASAIEADVDDSRADRIKKDLTFLNGDWNQELGGSPLMPFYDHDNPKFGYAAPKKLVSFWVTNVSPVQQVKNAVSVSAVMDIGITSSNPFSQKPYDWPPRFHKQEGMSRLTITFEGIYTESGENGGSRYLCLLGNATLPTLNQDVDSWETENQHGSNHDQHSSLVLDDQIMLVLEYQDSRRIHGEMKSLNQKWNLTYFDEVKISSRLGFKPAVKFGSEELMAKVCSPYPYQDDLVEKKTELFKGHDSYEYCDKLQQFMQNGTFHFVPNSKSVGSKDYYKELGLFLLGKEMVEDDSLFEKLKLTVQSLKCEPGDDENGIQSTSVSAVFRLTEEDGTTGVPTTTLSAEGILRSSHGQLCMVACLENSGSPSRKCSSRICLYLPLVFSIQQRSTVFGTISSIKETEEHLSLRFQNAPRLHHITGSYIFNTNLEWSYKYTKIMQACEYKKRDKSSKLITLLRKSLLWFPPLKNNSISDFSLLSDLLTVAVCVDPQTSYHGIKLRLLYAELEVLSLGSQFGRHYSSSPDQRHQIQEQVDSRTVAIEISANLRIVGGEFNRVPMFLEGIYDPTVGEMYLVGCRGVGTFLKHSNSGKFMNLEGGMDCQVEVKVKYPPGNARWLLHPTIKISIISKRVETDLLYFSPLSVSTLLVWSREKMDKVLVEKAVKRCFRYKLFHLM